MFWLLIFSPQTNYKKKTLNKSGMQFNHTLFNHIRIDPQKDIYCQCVRYIAGYGLKQSKIIFEYQPLNIEKLTEFID